MDRDLRHPNDVKLTEQQKLHAFYKWQIRSVQFQADRLVAKTLGNNQPTIADPMFDTLAETATLSTQSWLKIARTAMCLSGNEVARRLGISRTSYYKIEAREIDGTAHLATIRRAAAAMGCELVFAIRPQAGSYSQVIWERLATTAQQLRTVTNANTTAKEQILAHVVYREMQHTAVRRAQRWNERFRQQLKRKSPKSETERKPQHSRAYFFIHDFQ